jgi:C4-dicarboxylate-specific signal transduction histidine kinase
VQDAQMLADMLSGECSRSANIMTQLEMLFHAKSSKAQGVCLTTLIGNVQAMLASRLAAYRVKLTCHVQNDCVLSGEPTQLEAVMVNIISNAITALADQPDPKLIDLSVLKQDGLCVIDLRDNGPGFDSVVLHHIGKRYISDRQEGTGIGLWLSKLIVESHHGQLNVSNQERGALVHIQLPLYQENNDMKQSA